MTQRRHSGARSGPRRAPALTLERLEDRSLLSASPAFTLDLRGLAVTNDYDPSRILVVFRSSPVSLPGTTVGQALGLVDGLHEVQLDPGTPVQQALQEYQGDARVLSAEPDYNLTSSAVPNDPQFGQQWALQNTGATGGTVGADVHAVQAWNVTQGSRRVVVAVMDTGIDYNHPDLYQNVWLNQAEVPLSRLKNLVDVDGDGIITFNDLNDARNQGAFKIADVNGDGRIDAADVLAPMVKDAGGNDTGAGGWADGISQDGDKAHLDDLVGWNSNTNTNNPFDDNGHGTHVAGVIGATGNNGVGIAGIAWNVELMPVKFLNQNGQGSISQFIAGLNYAVAHGAQISNNSWSAGAFLSNDLLAAIGNARSRGQIFVASANNGGANNDTTPSYPSNFNLDNIVAVAATDRNDNLASWSNYGPTSVDLGAPGDSVLSTLPGNNYGTMSGTSMATPQVTGALALVWGQHPGWTYQQVIAQVLNTVDKLPSLAGKVATGGRLDVAAAVGATNAPASTPAVPVAPPVVQSATFSGPAPNVLSSARVTFDRAINPSSFDPADASLVGPGGQTVTASNVGVVAGTNNTTFDVAFGAQTAPGTYTLNVTGVRDTTGTPNQAFHATFAIDNAVTFSSTRPATVPPGGRAVSLLFVGNSFSLARLTVGLDITAPRTGDLYIHLQAPDGTDVVLAKYVGGPGQNFSGTYFDDRGTTSITAGTAPFTGTFQPYVPLSYFNGKNVHGYWKLWVEDLTGTYQNTLNSWSLSFTPNGGTATSSVTDEAIASAIELGALKEPRSSLGGE